MSAWMLVHVDEKPTTAGHADRSNPAEWIRSRKIGCGNDIKTRDTDVVAAGL
jgi:hypothetical protein